MKLPTQARIAATLFLTCVLAACGNKGPLVMPDPGATPAPAVDPPAADPPPPAAGTESESEGGTPAAR